MSSSGLGFFGAGWGPGLSPAFDLTGGLGRPVIASGVTWSRILPLAAAGFAGALAAGADQGLPVSAGRGAGGDVGPDAGAVGRGAAAGVAGEVAGGVVPGVVGTGAAAGAEGSQSPRRFRSPSFQIARL